MIEKPQDCEKSDIESFIDLDKKVWFAPGPVPEFINVQTLSQFIDGLKHRALDDLSESPAMQRSIVYLSCRDLSRSAKDEAEVIVTIRGSHQVAIDYNHSKGDFPPVNSNIPRNYATDLYDVTIELLDAAVVAMDGWMKHDRGRYASHIVIEPCDIGTLIERVSTTLDAETFRIRIKDLATLIQLRHGAGRSEAHKVWEEVVDSLKRARKTFNSDGNLGGD
ncbi:hypothetical protein NW762_002426 [Fusarium torreyae]|uniref:Uncharacterized protein n=1 Tax=Fusarium torreyae TaxID=1237075 RepID=A0A9W8SB84_9HYPO|nr:hypothetical protein NW762_002426 [Fusarium torreyae]